MRKGGYVVLAAVLLTAATALLLSSKNKDSAEARMRTVLFTHKLHLPNSPDADRMHPHSDSHTRSDSRPHTRHPSQKEPSLAEATAVDALGSAGDDAGDETAQDDAHGESARIHAAESHRDVLPVTDVEHAAAEDDAGVVDYRGIRIFDVNVHGTKIDDGDSLEPLDCGSPAIDGYKHVNLTCLSESSTMADWIARGESNDGYAVWMERGASYDGIGVKWGPHNKKDSPYECALDCYNFEPDLKANQFPCNLWVYCPDDECFEPDAHTHTKGGPSENKYINGARGWNPAIRKINEINQINDRRPAGGRPAKFT